MGGMDLTMTNLFQFFAAVSPLMLGFFMVMISIFNQDLKGIVYLAGILITLLINCFLLKTIGSNGKDKEGNRINGPDGKPLPFPSEYCNLINLPFGLSQYNSPALNSVFIAFTIAYLFIPMIINKQMNYAIVFTMLSLFIIDGVTKVINHCTTWGGVIIGLISGFLFGTIWYFIFHAAGYDSLVYFDETVSNKVYCARPKKQTFKCAVYKNGEVIKTL